MKAYIFLSVHEELFHRMAQRLCALGVTSVGAFAWGKQQERALAGRGVAYDPLVVFTRDLQPHADDGTPPDLAWLAQRERELGVSLRRMLAAERHLLAGRSYDQIMRMAEVALRSIADVLDRHRPDFVFSEDISCFHSYAHFVLARERGIPFWCIGTGRLPGRVMVYSIGFQRSERVEAEYRALLERGLDEAQRTEAEHYIARFRDRPQRPPGMATRAVRPSIAISDLGRFGGAFARYFGDRHDPTVIAPHDVVRRRLGRMARVKLADFERLFERPVPGERYVLYPIHFQPEASTLVQAPFYLDQVNLLAEMARALPADHRLYVKEHVSNRGRRPLQFYRQIKAIPGVRLLGPDEDVWSLIRGASAVAVITGTMGWEGLLFDKPVITFGDVFFDHLPGVLRARDYAKDDWHELFAQAIAAPPPDRRALLAMIAALHRGTYPGFMGNPSTFPEVLDEANVDNLTRALATEVGLA